MPWTRNGCYSATSIRSEQRISHLSSVEHRVGRVLQGCDPAALILDVVEVILDCLANDVGSAAVELLGGSIQLSAEGFGEPGRDLDQGDVRRMRSTKQTHRLSGCSQKPRCLLVKSRQLDAPSWRPP